MPANILSENHIADQIDVYYYWRVSRHIFRNGVDAEEPAALDKIDWDHDIFGADCIVLEINEEIFGDGENTHYTEFMKQAEKRLPQ